MWGPTRAGLERCGLSAMHVGDWMLFEKTQVLKPLLPVLPPVGSRGRHGSDAANSEPGLRTRSGGAGC